MGEDVMMIAKKMHRLALIPQVLFESTTQRTAASALGLSELQLKRLRPKLGMRCITRCEWVACRME